MSVVPITANGLNIMVDACREILKCEKCKEHARKILKALSQE